MHSTLSVAWLFYSYQALIHLSKISTGVNHEFLTIIPTNPQIEPVLTTSKTETSACTSRKLHARISTAVRLSTPYALTGFDASMSSTEMESCCASRPRNASDTAVLASSRLLAVLSFS